VGSQCEREPSEWWEFRERLELSKLMFIILAFSEGHTSVGMTFNVFLIVATLFQIAITSGVWQLILQSKTIDVFSKGSVF
jgi:hypothetical protein